MKILDKILGRKTTAASPPPAENRRVIEIRALRRRLVPRDLQFF